MSYDLFAYLLIFYCLKTNGDRVGMLQKKLSKLGKHPCIAEKAWLDVSVGNDTCLPYVRNTRYRS